MFLLLYNIAIRLYLAAISIAGLWNAKARQWKAGRRGWEKMVEARMRGNSRPVVWMHSASLGEFEQGRYLLDNLRLQYPDICIVVTFFSPSGFETSKNYKGADHIFYLPFPSRSNAQRFVSLIRPRLVLWIKYDYWYHYLQVLSNERVRVLLISAIFLRHHPFFKWYGGLYRKMLHSFRWLFVQTPDSARRLAAIGLEENVSVNGDTRFDRVIDIAANFSPIAAVERFIGGKKVIVAGSTWPEDEEELDHFANVREDLRFIIAPHEIHEEHLNDIGKLFRRSVRFSEMAGQMEAGSWESEKYNTLVIDNIGMLSRLYHYATIAYVGGGFGKDGVHNVLEAAVYGKPVVFGPVFNQFREAIELLEEGGAFTIDSALELEEKLLQLLDDAQLYNESAQAAAAYVASKKGATKNILDYIQVNRLLTS